MHFSGNIKITKISDDIWEMARIRLFCEFYFENQFFKKFLKIQLSVNFLWVTRGLTKNLGLIV